MSIKPEPSIIFKYSIEHIAKHFKAVRLAFGCSLDEIAANLGYTRHTVSKYEDPTYIWKPHDYYALRCMLELLAFSIQDTEYYPQIFSAFWVVIYFLCFIFTSTVIVSFIRAT